MRDSENEENLIKDSKETERITVPKVQKFSKKKL